MQRLFTHYAVILCRPVTITRLLIRGSIEEPVMRIQEEKQALFVDAVDSDVATTVDQPTSQETRDELDGLLDAM